VASTSTIKPASASRRSGSRCVKPRARNTAKAKRPMAAAPASQPSATSVVPAVQRKSSSSISPPWARLSVA